MTPATIFTDEDIDRDAILSRRIGIIGYGGQGHAQALNLRDSGCEVRVGLRAGGPSVLRAECDGFAVGTIKEVAAWADVVILLLPDHVHASVFKHAILPVLRPRATLMVAAAFSIHYGLLVPPPDDDVAMVAPIGPGTALRSLFLDGSGVPALFAVRQDVTGDAGRLALSYAAALGCGRIGVLETSFAEEAVTDAFGEQAVLCGGLTALIKAGFDTLVQAGYAPEIAYFECLHQVKLIADLLQRGGLVYMHRTISETAELGDYLTGPRIIDTHVREAMRDVLAGIQAGDFALRLIEESEAGMPTLRAERAQEEASEIERVGERLRALMRRSE